MMRSELASERIQRIDPQTGIRVIQITSYPSPAAHFHYDWPSITPDNRRVVFFCQRYVGRGAPWDLFRCDTDGLNLFQLTRRGAHDEVGGYYGRPSAVLSLDGTTIYVVWNKLLCAVDVETGKIDELLPLQDVCPRESQVTRIALASAGRLLFIGYGGPAQGAVRVDLATAKFDRIDLQGQLFGCLQAEPRLVVQRGTVQWGTVAGTDGTRSVTHVGSELSLWNTDQDGGNGRFICPSIFAHATLLGKTSMVQGCARQPDHCIWLVEREGVEPKKLVEGPYFWHSGASFDGQWILADTDSPDQGLQLVHAPTGHFRTLCYAGATQDHVEFGHPHPALSQDGRVAVFRSDRTHASQVYVAHITDEFRERVQAGAPDAKR
ncbi:MAG: hypothetical protein A2W31_11725 [Planctomycetes bacterium RBG_16_64_10]|nr:MAG: hypothetical protein A2W31_11725 [Planctomycetes bacterium RBG_16_64_10]